MFDTGAPIQDFHLSLILLEGGHLDSNVKYAQNVLKKTEKKNHFIFILFSHFILVLTASIFADNPCSVVLPIK